MLKAENKFKPKDSATNRFQNISNRKITKKNRKITSKKIADFQNLKSCSLRHQLLIDDGGSSVGHLMNVLYYKVFPALLSNENLRWYTRNELKITGFKCRHNLCFEALQFCKANACTLFSVEQLSMAEKISSEKADFSLEYTVCKNARICITMQL